MCEVQKYGKKAIFAVNLEFLAKKLAENQKYFKFYTSVAKKPCVHHFNAKLMRKS
jgi:hypothetical protein